jgi:hypothetical protein
VTNRAGLEEFSDWKSVPSDWLLEHDPLWNAALLDSGDNELLLVSKYGVPFAGVFVHNTLLGVQLGPISLGSVSTRRFVLTGGLPHGTAHMSELADVLIELAKRLGPQGAIFLQGVHADEPLRSSLNLPEVRQRYYVLMHGPSYRRCRIRLESSYEAYLATLGGATRKDLRKTMRIFRERVGEAASLQIISTPNDFEAILPELERLSAKTYQSRLGLGIERNGVIARRLFLGVKAGIGRVYVLRANGDPISFQVGYCYRNTFYATQTGYDPARADLQPGIVVLALMLESFFCHDPHLRYVDFMYGESLYKKRLSNTFHDESQFYLIPRTARGASVWLAFQAVDFASRAIGKLLEKAKIKQTVARLLRRFRVMQTR